MKKTLYAIIPVLILTLLACVCTASASGTVNLRKADFTIDGDTAYVIAPGEVNAVLCLENTEETAKAASLILACYDGNMLTDVKYSSISISSGTAMYDAGSVTVEDDAAHPGVNAYVWGNGQTPLVNKATLNDVSGDTSIKSFDLEVSGKTYRADVNMYNSGILSVEGAYSGINPAPSVTGNCAPTVAVAQGTDVSPESGTAVDLIGGTTYTVTAPNGNKATYDIKLAQMQLGWDEAFTGSYITGAADVTNGKNYARYAPTFGTWRGMTNYLSDGWGYWRTRTSNDRIQLAINNETAPAANDFLSMRLVGTGDDQIYYTLKNPLPTAGTPNCKRLVFSFDFRGSDITQGVYGWVGSFVSGFVIAKTPEGDVRIMQRINGADAAPVTVATVPMNEWHNLKFIATKTATGFDVEYYVDNEHVYSHDMSRKYTFQGYTTTGAIGTDSLIRFFMLSGESGRFDIDNCYALFTRV